MKTDRRTFINRMLATAAGLATTRLIGLPISGIARSLDAPDFAAGSSGNPLRLLTDFTGLEMIAQVGSQEVWPGEQTPVWTLGGIYPSPTIRVARGDRFALTLRNELAEPTIVHWHGQVIPHEMDGHPMDAIATGEDFAYSFDVASRAGSYWYHPHPHGRSAPQIYMGMAGFFIVTDEEEESLGLPPGEFDIPLLIHDRLAADTHRFVYEPDTIAILNGLIGDTMLVNGTPDAFLEVAAGLYRFRVLNGSNARILKLGFTNGKKFHLIGTDGGLLDRPYEVEEVMLGPAERADLLIDFSENAVGESLEFNTLRFGSAGTPNQHGYPLPVLRFDIVRSGSGTSIIPERLATIERLDPAKASRTQRIELQTNPGHPQHVFHTINGKIFDMHRIDLTAGDGDIEIWEIVNLHIMPHPIHIHGVQFQVLERINGLPTTPMDNGWKDTILVWREETVRVIMRFGPYRGTYLIHCHNLEHEDGGMMLNYEVTESTSAVDAGQTVPAALDLK